MRRKFILAVFCLSFATAARAAELADVLDPLVKGHHGKVSVAIKHLGTGESYRYEAERTMPTASLIKFPLMITTYQAIEDKKLDPAQKITLKKEDKVPGSGILSSQFSDGLELSLNDAIHLMIVYSDNTATNLVINQVGLPATAEFMEKIGCPNTKLNSKVFRGDTSIFPERSRQFGLGSTTADEIVKLLEMVADGKVVSKAACDIMLGHMRACDDHTKLPRFLPAGTLVAHKTGEVAASRCDAGIIDTPSGPLAICVLTSENEDMKWSDDNEATLLIAKIGEAAYKHFVPEGSGQAKAGEPGVLAIGAGGKLVEALQRTLNARSKPSPDLGVDGDFGGATEAAVKAFQTEKKLPPTGVVDAKTWEALGTLVEAADVASPEVINAKPWDRQPEDDPSGRPFVTAKAWAIADAKTGKLLWGDHENEVRDIASTTKVMTAYLVLKYAKEHPEALDEIVTYSKRADETEGSTAAVETGEKVSVRELMYGLLLPSGNDASVAYAEHFGDRLSPGGDATTTGGKTPETDEARAKAYDHFIAAMNAAAKELGMTNSHFANPNGLPEEGHHATAADLVKVADAALKIPFFAEVVNTPQHGATVVGPGGYKRNVAWYNTNRLLGIEGYDGVKTGTTNAAGCCLISRAERGDKALLMVVLGSVTSDDRYNDTRNLYQWAWRQLEKPAH